MVPFSIQETEHFREDVEVHREKIVLSSSSDSSDLKPRETISSSEDDWAEVQVEEVELDVKDVKDDKCKDAKPKNTLRRFAFFHLTTNGATKIIVLQIDLETISRV